MSATDPKFKGFAATTVPPELREWIDTSWYMDASASCIMRHGTEKHPRGGFIVWVQADKEEDRRLPDQPRFQLDFTPDVLNWGGKETKTLLLSDDLGEILKLVGRKTQCRT